MGLDVIPRTLHVIARRFPTKQSQLPSERLLYAARLPLRWNRNSGKKPAAAPRNDSEGIRLYRLHALNFRNAYFHNLLDPAFERDLRERAATACTEHPHIANAIFKFHKLNIAQMLGDKRTDFLKRLFNFLLNGRRYHNLDKLSYSMLK